MIWLLPLPMPTTPARSSRCCLGQGQYEHWAQHEQNVRNEFEQKCENIIPFTMFETLCFLYTLTPHEEKGFELRFYRCSLYINSFSKLPILELVYIGDRYFRSSFHLILRNKAAGECFKTNTTQSFYPIFMTESSRIQY